MRAEIELRVSGHFLGASLSPNCTTVVTFLWDCKTFGSRDALLPHHHKKWIANSWYHTHTERKKKNVPHQEKYLLLLILCFYKKSDGLNAMVRGKPCPKVNTDSSGM